MRATRLFCLGSCLLLGLASFAACRTTKFDPGSTPQSTTTTASSPYYMTLVGYQKASRRHPTRPDLRNPGKAAHTFATFGQFTEAGDQASLEDEFTISWLPADNFGAVIQGPVPGRNWSLAFSILLGTSFERRPAVMAGWQEHGRMVVTTEERNYLLADRSRIRDRMIMMRWGPFPITEAMYERAQRRFKQLNQYGQMGVDNFARERDAIQRNSRQTSIFKGRPSGGVLRQDEASRPGIYYSVVDLNREMGFPANRSAEGLDPEPRSDSNCFHAIADMYGSGLKTGGVLGTRDMLYNGTHRGFVATDEVLGWFLRKDAQNIFVDYPRARGEVLPFIRRYQHIADAWGIGFIPHAASLPASTVGGANPSQAERQREVIPEEGEEPIPTGGGDQPADGAEESANEEEGELTCSGQLLGRMPACWRGEYTLTFAADWRSARLKLKVADKAPSALERCSDYEAELSACGERGDEHFCYEKGADQPYVAITRGREAISLSVSGYPRRNQVFVLGELSDCR